MLSKFMPQNPKFASIFSLSAQNAHATAQALLDLLEHYTDVEHKVQRVLELEHEGDRINDEVTDLLAESFVVPFDREDILVLNEVLDDLVDNIEEAAHKMSLYQIAQPHPAMTQLARIVEQQCAILAQIMPLIEDSRKNDELRSLTRKIRDLEDEGDRINAEAMRHLYDGVTQVPQMIATMRSGEIIELIEGASDLAQRVAKTVESILLKNA